MFLLKATSNEKNVNDFNKHLCLALVAVNIPWYKLQVSQFHSFLGKYTGRHDETVLRKNYLWTVLCKNFIGN